MESKVLKEFIYGFYYHVGSPPSFSMCQLFFSSSKSMSIKFGPKPNNKFSGHSSVRFSHPSPFCCVFV